jgi:hypothetical protein
VEHGLFLGLATDVIVATGQGVRHLKRDALISVSGETSYEGETSIEGSKGGEGDDRD